MAKKEVTVTIKLTEEQKTKIEAVKKEATKIGIKVGTVGVLRLLFMLVVVNVLNQLTIQNSFFVAGAAFVSTMCAISMMNHDLEAELVVLRQKVQDILKNN